MSTSRLRVKGKAGAQLGNLNGAVHPWRAFWKRRALRPEDRWVMSLVENYERGIEEDRGRSLSFAEQRVTGDREGGAGVPVASDGRVRGARDHARVRHHDEQPGAR